MGKGKAKRKDAAKGADKASKEAHKHGNRHADRRSGAGPQTAARTPMVEDDLDAYYDEADGVDFGPADGVPDAPEVERDQLTQRDVAAELASELADVVYALQIRPEVRFVYISRSMEALLGYEPEDLYDDPEFGMKLVDKRDRQVVLDAIARPGPDPVNFTVRFRARDKRLIWTEHRARAVAYEDGQVVLYGAARDVTTHRFTQEALTDERERYRLLSENSQDVVLRSDADNLVTWASPSVVVALGWEPEDLIGRTLAEIVHPDDLMAGYHAQQRILLEGLDTVEGEARFLTPTGEWRWMRVLGRVLQDDEGNMVGSIGELRDIQSEMATRAELEREVDHDALTGLAKRGLTLARVQALLDGPDRAGLALLCASVDGLVAVNEAFTHTAGDRVLTVVSERLIEAVGDVDRLGRIAGGEFLVILTDVYTADEAGARAAELLGQLRGPVSIGPHEIEVTASIGVAMPDGDDASELMRDATTAMRQASVKGHDRWEFLDAERAHASRHRLAVQTALRRALTEDRIKPWYQPVVNLADSSVVGYEALVRWERSDGTVLEPAQFFDAAERSHLITTLDRIVLRHALDDMAQVDSRLIIAVNVSAATLSDGSFFDYVAAELERTGFDPQRLSLEVTETSLVDVSDAVRAGMTSLAQRGVVWWVDDFGTGYSSISHLRDLPVGGLKLDRSFTVGVASGDQRSIRVSQGLAGLARGLALRMVVEGVQGERDAAILLGQGWTFAQGWYFGRAERRMTQHLAAAPVGE